MDERKIKKIFTIFQNRNYGWIIKVKSNVIIKSVLLNLLYLFGMNLLFRAFFSDDDFLMSEKCYGIFEDDYDYRLNYINHNYGKFLVFLLKLFPNIPWYTIVFYICIFISLTLLTCIILEWKNDILGFIISNILILFISYEGYISIQFTKVAGITGAVGFFVLLLTYSSWKQKGVGIGLLILSCMLRYNVAQMVVSAWIVIFILKNVLDRLQYKYIDKKKIIREGICLIAGVIVYCGIPHIPQYSSDENVYWSYYWKMNAIRSAIQDYEVPDYVENKEVYEKIGVSPNDIYIWRSWNPDSYAMTLQRGQIIQKLQSGEQVNIEELDTEIYTDKDPWLNIKQKDEKIVEKENTLLRNIKSKIVSIQRLLKKVFNWQSFSQFCKKFPKAFLTMDVFFSYLILIFSMILIGGFALKKIVGAVGISFAIMELLNYYLFINQRYLIHRVDVGILLLACLGFLFCMMDKNESREHSKKNISLYIVLIIVLLGGKYGVYSEDKKRVSDLTMEQNNVFFQNTAEDDKYCYLLTTTREDGVRQNAFFYDVFDVPKEGSCKNCFYGNNLYEASRRREYGIKNLFTEIVDNNIYLVMKENDTNQEAWRIYFSEHTESDVSLTLVKQFLGKKIYRVHSKPFEEIIDLSKVDDTNEMVVSQIKCIVSESKLNFLGVAYLKGKNGFSQNTYIEILDTETGNYKLYNTVMRERDDKTLTDDGYFSNISAELDLPEFYSSDDTINLVIEQSGKIYSRQLNQGDLQYGK